MVPLVDTVRAAGGAPWVQEKPEKLEPWAGGVHTREEQGADMILGPGWCQSGPGIGNIQAYTPIVDGEGIG